MSVLKRKRRISDNEYDNTFKELYHYSREQTSKISRRRQPWISYAIDDLMNKIMLSLTDVYTGYYPKGTKEEAAKSKYKFAIENLLKLEPLLDVLCCVECYSTQKMEHWCELINKEIIVLNMKFDEPITEGRVEAIKWNTVNDVEFMKSMKILVRKTYSQIIKAPHKFDKTVSSLLGNNISNAWVLLLRANKKIPETKSEYERRRKNISNAISCLKKAQSGFEAFIAYTDMSEKTISEWVELLVSEIKMLYGLQKSDKDRFGNLKD